MSIKEYLKKNNISIADISRDSGIPYTTVGDIINGRTDVDNASVGVLHGIADRVNMTMEELYQILKNDNSVPELHDGYRIIISNGKYFIKKDGNRTLLCKKNEVNTRFIKEIAETFIKNDEMKRRFSQWKAT